MTIESIGSSLLFPPQGTPNRDEPGPEDKAETTPKDNEPKGEAKPTDGPAASDPPKEASQPLPPSAPAAVTPAQPAADPVFVANVAPPPPPSFEAAETADLDLSSQETSLDEARAKAAAVQEDLRMAAVLDQITSITDPGREPTEDTRFAEDASLVREMAEAQVSPAVDRVS